MMIGILLFLLIVLVLQLNIWLFIFAYHKVKTEGLFSSAEERSKKSKENLPPTLQDLLGEL
jgi:hypothetical protein